MSAFRGLQKKVERPIWGVLGFWLCLKGAQNWAFDSTTKMSQKGQQLP